VNALQPQTLAPEILRHLDSQMESARRLLASILSQGKSIRRQDVEGVMARLADIKAEMDLRARLEAERVTILTRAGAELGVQPAGVTLEGLTTLMSPDEAELARTRSAELRGLLDEIAREHGVNRALMRQELAFLDHLMRLLGQEADAGYTPNGQGPSPQSPHRAFDLKA
jgi:hypothetical protein